MWQPQGAASCLHWFYRICICVFETISISQPFAASHHMGGKSLTHCYVSSRYCSVKKIVELSSNEESLREFRRPELRFSTGEAPVYALACDDHHLIAGTSGFVQVRQEWCRAAARRVSTRCSVLFEKPVLICCMLFVEGWVFEVMPLIVYTVISAMRLLYLLYCTAHAKPE